jgi:prepilin-type N-terminal cleavage/methylation domain-containing protein
MKKNGFTLIEMLVVITTFAMVAIIATQTVAQSLKNIRKVDATTKIRQSADFALGVMERQLRSASAITQCPNTNTRRIDYTDQLKKAAYFSCENIGSGGYIASSGAQLTSNSSEITACAIRCTQGSTGPANISISFTIKDALPNATEQISVSTSVVLRSY